MYTQNDFDLKLGGNSTSRNSESFESQDLKNIINLIENISQYVSIKPILFPSTMVSAFVNYTLCKGIFFWISFMISMAPSIIILKKKTLKKYARFISYKWAEHCSNGEK